MRYLVTILLLTTVLGACATRPTQTAYAAPSGESWAIALKHQALSDTIKLIVDGHVVATSGFGEGSTRGTGIYRGQLFSFSCATRAKCVVYAGGLRLARLQADAGDSRVALGVAAAL